MLVDLFKNQRTHLEFTR